MDDLFCSKLGLGPASLSSRSGPAAFEEVDLDPILDLDFNWQSINPCSQTGTGLW